MATTNIVTFLAPVTTAPEVGYELRRDYHGERGVMFPRTREGLSAARRRLAEVIIIDPISRYVISEITDTGRESLETAISPEGEIEQKWCCIMQREIIAEVNPVPRRSARAWRGK
jgi:hypothetical protein